MIHPSKPPLLFAVSNIEGYYEHIIPFERVNGNKNKSGMTSANPTSGFTTAVKHSKRGMHHSHKPRV
jgi:hypothetical protein